MSNTESKAVAVKKIKVYAMDAVVKADDSAWEPFTFDHTFAIVEGDEQYVYFGTEGVGYIRDNGEPIEIDCTKIREEGSIAIMAEGRLKASLETIKEFAEVEEVYIDQFVRKFGDRLEQNYRAMLRLINDIGLTSSEYHDGKRVNGDD